MALDSRSGVGMTFIAVGMVCVLAGLSYLVLAADLFEGRARLKVEKDCAVIESSFGSGHFIPELFETLQSKVVLVRVITNLGLAAKWGDERIEDAYVRLKKHLDVRQQVGRSLIEIRYVSGDREEGADLPNAIARTFRDSRLEQRRAGQEGVVAVFEELLQKQELMISEQASKEEKSEEELQKLKRMREQLLIKIQHEKEKLIGSGVELIDMAMAPERPIRPQRVLGFGLMGVGIVLGGLGATMRGRKKGL